MDNLRAHLLEFQKLLFLSIRASLAASDDADVPPACCNSFSYLISLLVFSFKTLSKSFLQEVVDDLLVVVVIVVVVVVVVAIANNR